jgi:hypothetical protein
MINKIFWLVYSFDVLLIPRRNDPIWECLRKSRSCSLFVVTDVSTTEIDIDKLNF